MTDADNPSFKDEYCPGPGGLAYNEAKARAEFGDEFIDRLMAKQAGFRGDWWQLAKLVKNLEDDSARDYVKLGGPVHNWNAWRKHVCGMISNGEKVEGIHLEHANLAGAHLEHAALHLAHLEHADLDRSKLKYADLSWARLDNATLHSAHLECSNLTCADLKHARLEMAHLEHADLRGAHLEHACLDRAWLENAELNDAHLENAYLGEAHLDHATLLRASLEHAKLFAAHLNYAELCFALLRHADFGGAHLEHADLGHSHLELASFAGANIAGAVVDGAELSQADLRGVKGLLFDDNRVRDIDIEGDAPDPWSVLRRKYTGPWFFVHLLLLIVFFTPYVARTFSLTVQSRGQEWAFAQFARLENALGDAHAAAGRESCEKTVDTVFRDWIQRAESALVESPLPEQSRARLMTRLHEVARSKDAFCAAIPDLGAALRSLREEYEATHPERPAIWMLLGEKSGWKWLLPLMVIVYNAIRGYLTMRVSMLRDAEERSQHSPTLEEYYGIFQPLRTVTQKKKASAGGGDGEEVKIKKSGWSHAIVAALFVTPGWERRDPWSAGRSSHPLLRPLRYLLTWFSEIPLRFGLYRLHQIARVLLWFAITAVAWNSYVWARDTMIRVPVEARANTPDTQAPQRFDAAGYDANHVVFPDNSRGMSTSTQ